MASAFRDKPSFPFGQFALCWHGGIRTERIVQLWRVVDWNPGIYAIARFELTEQGSGTKIVFEHIRMTAAPNMGLCPKLRSFRFRAEMVE